MATLRDCLGLRPSGVCVLKTELATIEVGDLLGVGLDPQLSGADRVGVCVASLPDLLLLLVVLDGQVESIVLIAPERDADTVLAIARAARCTTLISDREDLVARSPRSVMSSDQGHEDRPVVETAWILTTSGTTGNPKLVRHSMSSLTRTSKVGSGEPAAWGLLYEATRFAGLQVVLQAIVGGGTLVAPSLDRDLGRRLAFLADNGCTHLSATPTLWRHILMHPESARLDPHQITLGGEIADEAILQALHRAFPRARVTHIYASTEAGVGFSVNDLHEGFPVTYLDHPPQGVELRVEDGRLWVRPPEVAKGYVGGDAFNVDADGFVDTLDRVERRDDRMVFLGRDNGSVNVGGVKVQPEEVERTIYEVPGVALVSVTSRRNPISGAILVASVVPQGGLQDREGLEQKVLERCRKALPREAVPAIVKLVDDLKTNAAGKLVRQ
jgi:acyl-CoA synthetase (AMP-forming)/AMP-acid ligase II